MANRPEERCPRCFEPDVEIAVRSGGRGSAGGFLARALFGRRSQSGEGAGTGATRYHAKCRVCRHEWEISPERARELGLPE
ncbi:hypothetical protein J2Z79_001070 [Symbiobacterium terraclitae]|uniref:Uncharacterized protein n=1 Tax=Symbiobacterium terraclitae TaxID=557451 RepID=A0ABS4JRU6_9FIRM|nr:hypothetical protein [Symbiobacterium terraclitae]MBP2017685.1 hypothetical protein [Symbiobacterium terraclitae]